MQRKNLTCAGNIEDGRAKSTLEAQGLSHVNLSQS
jgi:hypothetical protein